MEEIKYIVNGNEMVTQLPKNLTREQISNEFKKAGITNWWLTGYLKLSYSKNLESPK